MQVFNNAELKDIPACLELINQRINTTDLTLDSPAEQWQQALGDWLNQDVAQPL